MVFTANQIKVTTLLPPNSKLIFHSCIITMQQQNRKINMHTSIPSIYVININSNRLKLINKHLKEKVIM